MRHVPRPILMLVLGALVVACARPADDNPLAGSATSTTSTTATTAPAPTGFTPAPIEWRRCDQGECATVQVPLDYDKPDGRRIELAVARVPAGGDRIGALFVNPGGPGATATDLAQVVALSLPRSVREHLDIVGVDPRGVGGSHPIDCGVDPAELYGVDPTMEDQDDIDALLSVTYEYVDDCTIKFGDVLPFVGTREAARDIDTVRAAMGDEQISFLGFSYGTAIGQVYADLFPTRVRAMVLDGVLELGPTGLELAADQAAGFETALSRFVQHCAAAEGCETAGNTLGVVEEVLAKAEQPGGIPAPQADRAAGPGEVNIGMALALYSESLWTQLDSALAAANGGNGSKLVRLADRYLTLGEFEVYFAVNCMDFVWPDDVDVFLAEAKRVGQQSPHFGEALVTDYIRCVEWPVPSDPLEATSARGAPPIIVVSTTGDPATPYEAGVAVARTLERGVLVTNEGEGHTAVGNGKRCIDDLVARYLVDLVVPDGDVTC